MRRSRRLSRLPRLSAARLIGYGARLLDHHLHADRLADHTAARWDALHRRERARVGFQAPGRDRAVVAKTDLDQC